MFSEAPVEIVKQLPTQLEAKEGATVELECEVSQPDVQSQWLQDEIEIVPTERFDIKVEDTKHALTIKDLIPEDEAEYSCVLPEEGVGTVCQLFVEGLYLFSTPLLLSGGPIMQHVFVFIFT